MSDNEFMSVCPSCSVPNVHGMSQYVISTPVARGYMLHSCGAVFHVLCSRDVLWMLHARVCIENSFVRGRFYWCTFLLLCT